ncbi:MAG: DEAD/DEAH box helicase [Deltaproteobacteria bacterium]|nr:DEAD/DEAH box helicase [Deltaproteobacteria bacterium]
MNDKSPIRSLKPGFLSSTRFSKLGLPDEIMDGLNDAGFEYCTPIQAETLPLSLNGKDVAGQAQTGTGKTAAFMVTVFARLLSIPEKKSGLPSALIVAPTRELALQIFDDARVLGAHTGLNIVPVVGGIDYQKQAAQLRKGADIVICTPGRIIDYIKQGIFKTSEIKIVVIDEADRLFDLGFTQDMRYILKKLPSYEKRQSMLFSATLSYKILALTYDYMNLPEFISVTPDEITVKGVEQVLYHVGKDEKLSLLLGLLAKENWTRVLIFMNTKSGVEWLTKKLQGNELPAEGITGDLPQRMRLQLMKRFKNNDIKILVATDVASRGIHVEDISHAINYDLPQDAENYIHRIGRTARAGKTGRALSLACEEYVYHLEPLEELLGYKIPIEWPEDEWFLEDKAGVIKFHSGTSDRKSGHLKSKVREKKEAHRPLGPRMAAMSSEPGGVFGLAPDHKKESVTEHSKGKSQEARRKRRKHHPKKKPVV